MCGLIERCARKCFDDHRKFLFPGSFFSSLFSSLWGSKELRILILGLDGAGKTTILYRLQVGEVVTTIPSETCWTSYVSSYDPPSLLPSLPPSLPPFLPPFLPPSFPPSLPSFLPPFSPFSFVSLPTAIGFNVETVTYKNLKFQGNVWIQRQTTHTSTHTH